MKAQLKMTKAKHEVLAAIKIITPKTAMEIIEDYKPIGLYITKEEGKYICIDNRTEEAWTEEFDCLKDALMWLCGYEVTSGSCSP